MREKESVKERERERFFFTSPLQKTKTTPGSFGLILEAKFCRLVLKVAGVIFRRMCWTTLVSRAFIYEKKYFVIRALTSTQISMQINVFVQQFRQQCPEKLIITSALYIFNSYCLEFPRKTHNLKLTNIHILKHIYLYIYDAPEFL